MILKHLSLQNFRSYTKSTFEFGNGTTVIVGPNTAGKTNIIEAIYLLASGTSFRAEKDVHMIQFNEELARVSARVDEVTLEVMLTTGNVLGAESPLKKFLVNNVSKRRVDFVGNLAVVLFSPQDLEIIVDSPSTRRNFLDGVLILVDRDYRLAHTTYIKALRQRNALLETALETGRRSEKQFSYWDTIIIQSGQTLTQKRETFINYLNSKEKDIFDFTVFYDKSIISHERLLQYKDAEVGSGVTLVGPHRDDFSVSMFNNVRQTTHDVKFFGSRGQQRLVVLQLKLLELSFMEQSLGVRPLFLLDDIFSELDSEHIKLVMEMLGLQQTILTTTHKEFLDKKFLKDADMVKLE